MLKNDQGPVLVWFRQDLRLADNPALHAAAGSQRPVAALYVLDDANAGQWAMGGASRWWLHGSLLALGKALNARGVRLILRHGPADRIVPAVAAEAGASAVHWNRCYEPFAEKRDAAIKTALKAAGVAAESFNGALLFEPWDLKTRGGGPFKVFTPFHRTAAKMAPPRPLPAPESVRGFGGAVKSETLEDWALRPAEPDWAAGLRNAWTPGEAPAWARLDAFLKADAAGYAKGRDVPGQDLTSRLSPHLHFGEISPRQVWYAAALDPNSGTEAFLREVFWREFSTHLLHHFPQMPDRPLRKAFARFPWKRDRKALAAWQRGRTGYPIVDAGMRELWHTGWMHNRVRMVTASFLVKHLLQPWQDGAAWFWDTLVDADLANNSAGWQWVAGCGADAAPYFRVFNPVLQGEKFDAGGAYVRRWVPEIARLPDDYIHKPWDAPSHVLKEAGVTLGETYPIPIVNHKAARDRALAAFKEMNENA